MSDPLDGTPQRLHPLTPVLDVLRAAPSGLLAVVLWTGGGPGVVAWAAIGLGLLLAYVAWRSLAWWRFTYRIDAREVVVESGVLDRTRRVVPLARVQQVDVQRRVRHLVTGLAIVRIDTAGAGDEPEVVLDAVSDAEARRIRAHLTAAAAAARGAPAPGPAPPGSWPVPAPDSAPAETAAPGTGTAPAPATPGGWPPPADPEVTVVAVGVPRLALAGVTGSKLAVVFAVLGAGFGLYDDLVARTGGGVPTDPPWEGLSAPGPLAVALLVAVALPVWLAVAAVAEVLADGGYRMTRRGDVLHVRRGVLDQREASLAVHRVQAVRIHRNALRRLLGLASITLQSAGGSGGGDDGDTRVVVPIVRFDEVDALLRHVLPDAPGLPALRPAPPAARRRAWLRRTVPAALVGVVVAWLARAAGPVVVAVPLAAVVLAAVAGELAYRGLGWASTGDHVVARRGGLARETVVVPVAKVQSTRLVSTPLQRRAGLATLLLDVAGRGSTPAIVDGDGDDLARLRHVALASTAARHDELDVRRRTAAAR